MCSYAIPRPEQTGTGVFPACSTPSDRPELPRLTLLSRELRRANADYRSMALYAGPLHRLTLEARRRMDDVAAALKAETERLRSGAIATHV